MRIKSTPFQHSLLISALVLFSSTLVAQVLEVTSGLPFTPQNLITNVFLGDGVEVISITYDGSDNAVGFFKDGETAVGMPRGIVMTTGRAVSQGADIGVNAPGSQQASVFTGTNLLDPDLRAIVGQGTPINDISRYTIVFRPYSDTLRFNYAFGSEEYPEFVCSDYNDIFGFFISGPGISGPYANGAENIALIPGTNLPVRINNVNPGVVGGNGDQNNCRPPLGSLSFSEFYNNNNGTPNLPVYDGLTDVFTAEAVVVPCELYTIKLVICDVGDASFDSGVFLEAKSFGSGSLDVAISGLNVDGGLAEGCRGGEIAFTLPRPAESDYPINFTLGGTATNGVDYGPIPTQLIIPAGDSVVTLNVEAYEDFIDEGEEFIELAVQRDACTRDTFLIILKENRLTRPDLGLDQAVCPGDAIQLNGAIPVVLPEPPRFENNTPLPVTQHNLQYASPINVQGVLPPILGPDVIKAVCIDSLEHRWIDDMDIYLQGPDGQFIELTTDNGGNGGNGAGFDYYIGTCFTPSATTTVNFPGPLAPPTALPLTGNWQPEGLWSDLWDSGARRTNGVWNLLLTDDAQGFPGTLYRWSICFEAPYEISYSWSPSLGLSCDDCPDPVAMSDVTTTYVLQIEDSYGCMVSDTLEVAANSSLTMSEVVCSSGSETEMGFSWLPVAGSLGYEVSVNGGPWEPANGLTAHLLTGLLPNQQVDIAVRALGSDCPTAPVLASCTTPNCTPPSANANPTSVSCFGAADGAVALGVADGTGPFIFTVDGQQNVTGQFNNLVAGLYVAEVEDAFGCTSTLSFAVGTPPDPGFAFVVDQPLRCADSNDGGLTLQVSNGAGPYQFTWDHGPTDSLVIGLAPAAYGLNLLDANGCTYRLDTVLTAPEALVLTTSAQDVDCFGGLTGSATVTVAGGTAPYNLSWDDPAGQNTPTAANLGAGAYEVLVTDANGCVSQTSVTVAEPPVLTAALNSTPATCANAATGAVEVIPAGGLPGYTYQWVADATGLTVGATAAVNNLVAGAYTVVLTDANGCATTQQVTVTEPLALALDLATTNPACATSADGQATATVVGGTGPYTYTWNGVAGGNQVSGLSAEMNTLAVSDANGCRIDTTFALSLPTAVTVALNLYSPSCADTADGAARAVVAGGTPPYSYTWPNGPGTDSVSNLAAGVFELTVLDANGCVGLAMGNIVAPTALSVALAGDDPACFGAANGQAQATVTGGTGAYSYTWSNGQNTDLATALVAGVYGLTVVDANGCQAEANVSLGQPAVLAAVTTGQDPSCAPNPDGSVSVAATGGIPPYAYNWSNGGLAADVVGVPAGNYMVTVTDLNGCSVEASLALAAPPIPTLQATFQDLSCFGAADGAIQTVAAGGTPPYVYTWSVPALPTTPNQNALPAGSYAVTVTDANACAATASINLAQPGPLVAIAQASAVNCAGEQTGAVALTTTGGVAPYAYAWSNGANTASLADVAAGVYQVTVTDANGCRQTASAIVTESSTLRLSLATQAVDCAGGATGGVGATVSGGQQPYRYQWSTGDTLAQLTQLPAGSYTLTLTDGFGCSLSLTETVTEPPAFTAQLRTEEVSCFGEKDGLLQVLAEGATPPYVYRLDGGNWSGSATFIALAGGVYTATVRDAKGCLYSAGTAEVTAPAPLTVDLPDRLEMRFGDSLQLSPQVSGDLPVVAYTWTPADSSIISCGDCPEPRVFPAYETDFRLLVTDENGCTAEALVRVLVRKDFPVAVPTGFTPNGDGQNDRLLVHGLPGVQVRLLRIYDRWGELVFQASNFVVNDPNVGWDGAFRGQPLNGGVFLWQVEAELPDGETASFQGQTTLLR